MLQTESANDFFNSSPLNRILQDFEQSPFHIPQIMDHVLSSMDRASGGLISSLTGPEIDFAKTDNGTHLIARIHLPDHSIQTNHNDAKRYLSIAILGRQHMRMKIETRSGNFFHSSTHTIPLPEAVERTNVTIQTMPDGTIHAFLKIIDGNENQISNSSITTHTSIKENNIHQPESLQRHWLPSFFQASQLDTEVKDSIEELPPTSDVVNCHTKFAKSKLLVKKCNCDVIPSLNSRAICYGKLISRSINTARKLGWDDFATSAKHMAIECTNNNDQTNCLEQVLKGITDALIQQKDPHAVNNPVAGVVREAIESQDDGPSDFQPSPITFIFRLFFAIFLVILCVVLVGICLLRKRNTQRSIAQLSSVLTQTIETKMSNTNLWSKVDIDNGASNMKKISTKNDSKLS